MNEVSTEIDINELVKKIETSELKYKKRIRACQVKIKKVIEEHLKEAKQNNLYAVAITLCFASPTSYSSKHISGFLCSLRKKLKQIGQKLQYAWVLEHSNVLHYHLIVWLPNGFTLTHKDLSKWWKAGSTWVQSCKSTKAWGKYIAKSHSKTDLPKGSRAFGYGGLSEEGKIEVQQTAIPLWLKAVLPRHERAKKHPDCGWVSIDTGLIYESPFIWTPRGYVSRAALNEGVETIQHSHSCAPMATAQPAL